LRIITEYPAYFFILCLLIGALYGTVLYYKNTKDDFSLRLRQLLFILRFIAVTFIAFFLLNPLIKMLTRETEKPVIIFAQDNSASLLMIPDSTYYKDTYPNEIEAFLKRFDNKYDVHTYSFGEKVSEGLSFSYDEKLTDIGQWLYQAQNIFYNRHVGAMVLASDGLYNAGVNPIYATSNMAFPIYTLALGDTTVYKDILVEKINHNRIVFLNNKFPVEVVINARKARGEKSNLSIYIDDKLVAQQGIIITDDNFSRTFSFMLEADKSGKRKIRAEVDMLAQETNIANNSATVYFDVIDSRHKVLLLYNAPHPDVFAIKSAIENNINYELEHSAANDFTASFDAYNLVILHALPSHNTPANHIFSKLNNSQVPLLYIMGNQTNVLLFNKLNTGLTIQNTRNSINEAMAFYNKSFPLFTLSENTKTTLQRMPPLYAPYGQYRLLPSAQVLLYQRIGAVNTQMPLIFFNESAERKIAVITGENYWRWRLADYAINENHHATNEIINKTVQYLALRVDKNNFRLTVKDIFYENENIIFDAEVYNESFEPINTEEVRMNIKSAEGVTYNYLFSRKGNAYTLDAGKLPVGAYTYEAQVSVGANIYNANGAFSVAPLNIESLNTIARHDVLYNISAAHNAETYYPNNLDALYNAIVNNDDIKPIIFEKIELTDLLNVYWLLFFIVLLLATEWFIRKWSGSY